MANRGILLISLTLLGCVVENRPMDWQATGGSRSDGVVKLSVQYGGMVRPILNEQQAIDEATRRCISWGYTKAEAFGGVINNCPEPSAIYDGVCRSAFLTKEYQCTTKKVVE